MSLFIGIISVVQLCFSYKEGYATNFIFFSILGVILLLSISAIRRKLITNFIYSFIKKNNLLPAISHSEKIVLGESGENWIEENFFRGEIDSKKIFSENYNKLSREEQLFLEKEVNELCEMVTDWEIFQNRDLPENVWNYLQEAGFFGLIIPKKYSGKGFSALGNSSIVQKLVTRSQVLAISVMVPNSLGPGELLLKYGTEKQKNYYLPRLAKGIDIPCFALTELHAGSDATAIQARGDLFRNKDGVIQIKLNWNKRYITLGAKATLIGVAFTLYDNESLLGDTSNLGITCALVSSNTEGVVAGRRHDPMGVPFINSPLNGVDVVIDIENIIGEEAGIGKGWKMLMECLAIGRGISLPALATGGIKYLYYVVSYYSVFRKQFGLSLYKFEGIKEAIVKIAGYKLYVRGYESFYS